MIAKYIGACLMLALGSASLAWSSWRLLNVADEVAASRVEKQEPQPGLVTVYRPVAAPRFAAQTVVDEVPEAVEVAASTSEGLRLTDVASPLAGRIESAGAVPTRLHDARQIERSLGAGDRVSKGQRLATIVSHDLGELKSRYVAAASRVMFEEASLARLREQQASKTTIAEAQRQCRGDRQRMERAERVLRELGLNDEQLADLRQAASQLHRGEPDYSDAERWAEFELLAPHDAILVEVRAPRGMAVAPGTVLFRMSRVDEPGAPASPDAISTLDDQPARLAEADIP